MPFYFYLAGLQIHLVSLLDCKVPLEIPSRIAQGAFFCMPYGYTIDFLFRFLNFD